MPASSEGVESRRHLEALQDELQALKARWGRALRLQRSTPAEAPGTAPFPIVLTFHVEPPPATAAHYDVSPVRIQIHLSRAALQLLHGGPSSSSDSSTGHQTHGSLPPRPAALPEGTRLAVLSDDLPRRLRKRIEQELLHIWLSAFEVSAAVAEGHSGGAAPHGGGAPSLSTTRQPKPYNLAAAASYMQECFLQLICSVPELVEPYQTEDENGATVRRYAILNTDGGDEAGEVGQASDDEAAAVGADRSARATAAVVLGSAASGAATAPPAGGAGGSSSSNRESAGDGVVATGMKAAAVPPPPSPPPPARASPAPSVLQATAAAGAMAVAAAAAVAPGDGSHSPQVARTAALDLDSRAKTSGGDVGALSSRREAQSSPGSPAQNPAAAERYPAAVAAAAAAPEVSEDNGDHHTAPTDLLERKGDPSPDVDASPPPPQPPPPQGLLVYNVALKELQYIQKRYSQVFSVRLHRDVPATGSSSSGGHKEQLLQPGCLTTFELELLPTDPDWDLPPIRVVGQLLPLSDTAFLPSLGVHLGSRLPQWLRAALEAHMAAQLAGQAAAAKAAAAAAAVAQPAGAIARPGCEIGDGACGRGQGRGGGGCGGRGALSYGAAGGGGDSVDGGMEDKAAPEGGVWLPLGALRNLFRYLENYAGAVARDAEEDRRRREREEAVAAATAASTDADSDDGNGGRSNDDGSRYDDDGYGDGSSRRESGAAAAPTGAEGSEEYDSDNDDDGHDTDGDDDGAAAVDEVGFSGTAAAAAGGTDAPAAYAVFLEGLQLDNLAAVEALRANFEVSCTRCGARDTVAIASAAVSGGGGGSSSHQATTSGRCQRCTAPWSLAMRPHFVHATSNSLCVIKPEGCRPVDLLPSLLAGQCGECSAVMSLREVQVGLPFSRHCSSCHKELSLSISAVSFVPRGPPQGAVSRSGPRSGTSAAAAARRRLRSDAAAAAAGSGGGGGGGALRPGQPLPAHGTCKHYRHSYRWLRFPCCGMRFPCDLCHEEAVPDGHSVRWAQRMVCGFCSLEQPLSLGCRACGRQLAGSAANPSGRHTRFWEGGTGCRDPRRLNKNDPHKWRGRNKTISAKQSRVGPKPWSSSGGGGGGGGGGSCSG